MQWRAGGLCAGGRLMLDHFAPDLTGLRDAARRLLPPDAAVAVADPLANHAILHRAELLPGAVPARLREFAAGRKAAHEAMALLGLTDLPIPMGQDRAPVWPEGITGSITHSRTACLAAIMRGDDAQGIGLDLEEDAPLSSDLWETILLPAEQEWLANQPKADRGQHAMLMFCAKEAAYKAQYARSKTLFGFDMLRIYLDDGAFTAEFQKPVAPFLHSSRLNGKYSRVQGHILTAVTL